MKGRKATTGIDGEEIRQKNEKKTREKMLQRIFLSIELIMMLLPFLSFWMENSYIVVHWFELKFEFDTKVVDSMWICSTLYAIVYEYAGMNVVRIDLLDSLYVLCVFYVCMLYVYEGCDPSCLLCTYLNYYSLCYSSKFELSNGKKMSRRNNFTMETVRTSWSKRETRRTEQQKKLGLK